MLHPKPSKVHPKMTLLHPTEGCTFGVYLLHPKRSGVGCTVHPKTRCYTPLRGVLNTPKPKGNPVNPKHQESRIWYLALESINLSSSQLQIGTLRSKKKSFDFFGIFSDLTYFSKIFFDHLGRSEIFPGIECAHLENQPMKLNMPKLACFFFSSNLHIPPWNLVDLE